MLETKLPDIAEFSRTYLGVEPLDEPVPVFPTCHYVMGGIPTNIQGQVLANNTDVVPGLFAAGECACVSVHGSNRLGTNSLLDINVFGRRAGIAAAELRQRHRRLHRAAGGTGRRRDRDGAASCGTRPAPSGSPTSAPPCRHTMDINAAVYRTEASLKEALNDIRLLKERYARVSIQDKGQRYNTDLLEAVELGFLLELAEVLVVGALVRTESRGGHAREDYPNRDDTNWMRHTMAYKQGLELTADIRLDYKPVVQTRYQPMERKY